LRVVRLRLDALLVAPFLDAAFLVVALFLVVAAFFRVLPVFFFVPAFLAAAFFLGAAFFRVVFLEPAESLEGGGTLAPFSLASDSPMAMACLRLVTFLPLRPLRNLPFFLLVHSFFYCVL